MCECTVIGTSALNVFAVALLLFTDEKITTTPLLEYLASVKQDRRDERKRKSDERRKNRDDDRQRKRDKVAKGIPKAISEVAKVSLVVQQVSMSRIFLTFLCFFVSGGGRRHCGAFNQIAFG